VHPPRPVEASLTGLLSDKIIFFTGSFLEKFGIGLLAVLIDTISLFMATRKRCTGLEHDLQWYSKAYKIPLSTIANIRRKYNPILLDCPVKLLQVLSEQRGPRVNLVELERIIAQRFAAGLKEKSINEDEIRKA
jgi:hypothetical protein